MCWSENYSCANWIQRKTRMFSPEHDEATHALAIITGDCGCIAPSSEKHRNGPKEFGRRRTSSIRFDHARIELGRFASSRTHAESAEWLGSCSSGRPLQPTKKKAIAIFEQCAFLKKKHFTGYGLAYTEASFAQDFQNPMHDRHASKLSKFYANFRQDEIKILN
jgi:hypothetical protein